MCEATTAGLAIAALSAGVSAYGVRQQSQTQKKIAQNNAISAENAAQDAYRRGEQTVQDQQRKVAAFKSSQSVGLAKNGLDLGYGTAADLQDQTDFFGQIDANTLRTNASKEAYNARAQRNIYQMEADAQRPWLASGSTVLSGAGQVASKWYA